MAPLRPSRTTRSAPRGAQNDIDIIDGLPIRQWRKILVPITTHPDSLNAPTSPTTTHTILPSGEPPLRLPQGSEQYTPWCKQILKAARSGTLGKRKERDEEREDEKENVEEEEVKTGFTACRYVPLPRSQEEEERVYLAPRRAGLPKLGGVQVNGGEVVVGGEEPVRRRMPPPRRKPKKGPGRRKKMTEGDGAGVSASAEALEGQHQENGTTKTNGEAGAEDGEDEEGDEGDEGGDDDREEGELSDDKEEESKEQLLEKFKGADTPTKAPVTATDAMGLDKPAKPEPTPAPAPPTLPGLQQPPQPTDREEGELDMDDEEEDYEPPPPKPAAEEEEEEEDYEPPPPTLAEPQQPAAT